MSNTDGENNIPPETQTEASIEPTIEPENTETVQQSDRNIGIESTDREPLIKKGVNKRLRRQNNEIREVPPEPVHDLPQNDYQSIPSNDEYLDAEFYANNGRFQVHKNYIIFLSNWRTILNVILFINTLLLITIFVSDFFIEILPTDGLANFNNFILILTALIGNCFNLWFNKIGLFSPFDLHLNVVLTFLPLLNLLTLSIIQYTRQRLNSITLGIHIWTSLTFSLGILQAYNLRRYIRNLTPPTTQNKHTLTEWIEIAFRNIVKFISLILLTLLLLTTFLEIIDIKNALNHEDESSKFVWANPEHSKRLHISCYGIADNSTDKAIISKQPIVVFEHGSEDTAYTSGRWIQELYHLGKIDQYCVYDRFGFGLSDSVGAPTSLRKSSDALKHALVDEMGLAGPFLLVGYDYGGLTARVFAGDHHDLCFGLMLIEAWNEELLLKHYLRKLLPGDGDSDGNSPTDGGKIDYRIPEKEIGKRYTVKSWLYGIWSCFGLNLQSSWFISHHGSMNRIYGKDMKEQGRFIRNRVLESITSSLSSYKEILETNIKIQDIKLSVVSSKQFIKKSAVWGNWQRKLTKLSSKAKEWRIIDGDHDFYNNRLGIEEAQDVLLRLINE